MILSQSDIDRFRSGVGRGDPDDCWPWLRSCTKGYGNFKLNGKQEQAHRVAWALVYGLIPVLFEGYPSMICHSCDNRWCCNPRHLFPGNRLINMKDCVDKDRSPGFGRNGEAHPCALITNLQAKEIKARYQRGETQTQIAEIYGIGQSAVSNVCSGKTWAHVI